MGTFALMQDALATGRISKTIFEVIVLADRSALLRVSDFVWFWTVILRNDQWISAEAID